MTWSRVGRADLLRAYLVGGEDALAETARRLGMRERGDDDAAPGDDADAPPTPRAAPHVATAPAHDAAPPRDDVPARSVRHVPSAESWRRVERRLTEHLARDRRGDVGGAAGLTEATARVRAVSSMRRRVVARWPRELLVVVDHDDRLAPLWRDQQRIVLRLARRLGRTGLAVEHVQRGGAGSRVGRVSPGAPVLRITGWVDSATGAETLRDIIARRAGLRGRRLAALAAGPEPDVGGVDVVPWGRAPASDLERSVAAWIFELVLAVPREIDPALLRSLRLGGDLPGADLATELDAWARLDERDGERGRYEHARRVATVATLREALASDEAALAAFAERHAAHVPDDPSARRALASTLRDGLRATLERLAPLVERADVEEVLARLAPRRR